MNTKENVLFKFPTTEEKNEDMAILCTTAKNGGGSMIDAHWNSFIEECSELDSQGRETILSLVRLFVHCPEFKKELVAAIPAGESSPPAEVIMELMDKWRPAIV